MSICFIIRRNLGNALVIDNINSAHGQGRKLEQKVGGPSFIPPLLLPSPPLPFLLSSFPLLHLPLPLEVGSILRLGGLDLKLTHRVGAEPGRQTLSSAFSAF